MSARVHQLNICGQGGVPKVAVDQAELSREGFIGDAFRFPFHGGPKKAVLLVTLEGIEELRALGYPLFPGALGENITSIGLDRRILRLGQHLVIGEAMIELVQPRTPCNTIAIYGSDIASAMYDARVQAHDPTSPLWGLSGFYCSVVRPGRIRAGDSITLEFDYEPR